MINTFKNIHVSEQVTIIDVPLIVMHNNIRQLNVSPCSAAYSMVRAISRRTRRIVLSRRRYLTVLYGNTSIPAQKLMT